MDGSKISSKQNVQLGQRVPLVERSNSIIGPLPSSRWSHKDSDESMPSPCSSVVDAAYLSDADIVKFRKISPRPVQVTSSLPAPVQPADIESDSPLARIESIPFLYGCGTELHPIAEQRSKATLRTASFSTSDLSSVLRDISDTCNDQAKETHSGPSHLRRRHTFSLSPLDRMTQQVSLTNQRDSPHQVYRIWSRTDTDSFVSPAPVYTSTYPHLPPCSPPRQPPTPIKDNDWMAHASPNTASNYASLHNFRAQRSSHGNLEAHPWVRLIHHQPLPPSQRTAGLRKDPATRQAGSAVSGSRSVSVRNVSLGRAGVRVQEDQGRVRICKACQRTAKEQWSL
ncbi:hypothetical protein BX600DRAFT_531166 [Xylariales sp. PMI_506]|nr:hypothetical protein BX600DRAFT_531166 [Xylariales sp. PMI_506]